jgi:uncharacterized OsmC-like protein
MTVKLKIGAVADCPTHTRSHVRAGGHAMIVDEPLERDGSGQGASPLEYLVTSLAGCTNVISNRIAARMGIDIRSMAVDVVADLDARVLAGESVEVAFPEVRIVVDVVSPDSASAFAALRERLEATCPVSVLFSQAGTKVVHDWTVTPPLD